MRLYAFLTVTQLAYKTTEHRFELNSGQRQERTMADLIYVLMAIGFFAAAIAYVHGCERLRGGSHD